MLILSWIALVVAGNLASSISGFLTQLPTFQARLPEILALSRGILVEDLGNVNDIDLRVDHIGYCLEVHAVALAKESLPVDVVCVVDDAGKQARVHPCPK